MPGFPVLHHLLELAQTHVHQVGDVIHPSHPLLSFSCLPSLLVSRTFPISWLFTSDGQSIGASAAASVPPMNIQDWFPLELTGLISLAVQGALKSLLQHHSSKASILQCLAFFMVYLPLSHPYVTTGKIVALTIWTFVSEIISLLFNRMSRFGITFLPRSKCLLFSWLQSPSAVILEPRKIKFVILSLVSPFICHEVMGPDTMILVFWMPALHT